MTLDSNTFDLVGMLTGATFPESTVDVYTNEAYGFAINTLLIARDTASRADTTDTQVKKIEREIKKTLKEAEPFKLTLTLKGISQESKELILSEVDKEFPAERDMLGRDKPNAERDLKTREAMWRAHIVKIENFEGKVVIPDLEGNIVRQFLKLGTTAVDSINRGIGELAEGTSAGLQAMAQEIAFL